MSIGLLPPFNCTHPAEGGLSSIYMKINIIPNDFWGRKGRFCPLVGFPCRRSGHHHRPGLAPRVIWTCLSVSRRSHYRSGILLGHRLGGELTDQNLLLGDDGKAFAAGHEFGQRRVEEKIPFAGTQILEGIPYGYGLSHRRCAALRA